jgi:hypothetical protein
MRVHTEASQVPHDIALTAINDGYSYAARCDNARRGRDNPLDYRIQSECTRFWYTLAAVTACKNHVRFQTPADPAPTAIEILTAAVELAEYMLNHVNECDEMEENSHV